MQGYYQRIKQQCAQEQQNDEQSTTPKRKNQFLLNPLPTWGTKAPVTFSPPKARRQTLAHVVSDSSGSSPLRQSAHSSRHASAAGEARSPASFAPTATAAARSPFRTTPSVAAAAAAAEEGKKALMVKRQSMPAQAVVARRRATTAAQQKTVSPVAEKRPAKVRTVHDCDCRVHCHGTNVPRTAPCHAASWAIR